MGQTIAASRQDKMLELSSASFTHRRRRSVTKSRNQRDISHLNLMVEVMSSTTQSINQLTCRKAQMNRIRHMIVSTSMRKCTENGWDVSSTKRSRSRSMKKRRRWRSIVQCKEAGVNPRKSHLTIGLELQYYDLRKKYNSSTKDWKHTR